jgi:hypothetical protein
VTIVAEKDGKVIYVGLNIVKAMTALGGGPVKQLVRGKRIRGKARKALNAFNRRLRSKESMNARAGKKTHLLWRYEREVLEEMQ